MRLNQSFLSLVIVVLSATAVAEDSNLEFGGHTKLRLVGQSYPDNSLFRDLTGAGSADVEGDVRLNFSASSGRWSFDTAYQFVTLYGDRVEYSRNLPAGGIFFDRLPSDDRRLFDLTDVIHDENKTAILHRLDRLWLGYTSEKAVVRFGRQALSWGNGMFYSPMDLVNPFDPAAIDTEFKAGDDMLYLQYLRDSGDDVQGAVVFRRDRATGNVDADAATVTLKYHGFAGETEYDFLVARSYDDTVAGIGGVRSIGGAVLRGDLVVTDTADDSYVQFVTNLSYSWTWYDRNMSGVVEYYFNGFGQHDERYDPLSLAANPDLLLRLSRGELFTLGRNYLAGSVTIEMSPLWTLTPTLLANVDDISGLFQLITQYSLGDNMTLLGSLNVSLGPDGTEFGGIAAGTPDRYLSTDAGVFAQIAFYF
jgi:hypothetical protein